MSNEPIIRKPAIIQEEIEDLRRYLNGIPEPLRTSGTFNSYEQRMVELNRELVVSRLYNLYLATMERPEIEVPTPFTYEKFYPTLDQRLQSLERQHKRSAECSALLTQVLQYSLLAGTACTLAAALLSVHSAFPVAFSLISVAIATILSFLRLPAKVRRQERLADYFMALRNETANILTPGGDISLQPRYYENSTKTIEKLIEDIRGQRQPVKGT